MRPTKTATDLPEEIKELLDADYPDAEIELSVFTKQFLSRRIADIDNLGGEAKAWTDDRNATQTGVDWKLTNDQARTNAQSATRPMTKINSAAMTSRVRRRNSRYQGSYSLPVCRSEDPVSVGHSCGECMTISLSIRMSGKVWGIPPTPGPDSIKPAKGIQSTRKAV